MNTYEMECCAMSFERLRESELFRTPAGWHENPDELGSGFCAQHKTKNELPPGVNDLRDDCEIRSTVCYAAVFMSKFTCPKDGAWRRSLFLYNSSFHCMHNNV